MVHYTTNGLEVHDLACLFPSMSDDEFRGLKSDIQSQGLLDPIILYENKIIDGRHRYRACQELGIVPRFEEYAGDSPIKFVVGKNNHRRHLTSSQKAVIALALEKEYAKLAKERQVQAGKAYGENHPKQEVTEKFPEALVGEAREQAAKELGTNARYVSDAKRIEQDAPELLEKISQNIITIPEAKELVKQSPEKREDIIQKAIETETPIYRIIEESRPKTPVMQSSESNEYYTPPQYIQAAYRVMGGIDLDPASCAIANQTVLAKQFYTIEDDGLAQDWQGRVWLNPPYGRQAGDFAAKLLKAYHAGKVTQAIMLVNANITETKWFAPFWDNLICFTNHRINFLNADDKSGSTHGSLFVYLGLKGAAFIREFRSFGVVVKRVDK